jgi:predicted Zn-dependent peptidase
MRSGGGGSGGERVARKDRERARKRHAIERARRDAGAETTVKEEQPDSRSGEKRGRQAASKTGTRRQPARSQATLHKAQVGDVDRKGRVYTRPMLLHPRVALLVYFVVLGVGLVSLLRRDPRLQALGYGAFALGMLVIADTKTTWTRAAPFILFAVVLAASAVVIAVGVG